jgi:hypothetical protein
MHISTPQSMCRFGIARGDITPPVGIYHRMWGAATHERSTGVHRPLTATALVFQELGSEPRGLEDSPSGLQVVAALDLCLLWAREMGAFLQTVCTATGLQREQITVAFSHTHGAGLMGLERAALPGGELIAPFLAAVAKTVAALIHEALGNMQEATITYGHGHCDLAANRDFWDSESGQYVCGFNPKGHADTTVLVGRVTRRADCQSAPLLATIVNYACHPTTLAWQNKLISPVFPGAMRELIERSTGAPCVFLQGASGDLGPREGFVGDVEIAERNGRQLGHAALSVLEALPPPQTRFTYSGPVVSGATLGAWSHVPLDDAALAALRRWRVERWTVALPYRGELSTLEQTRQELRLWQEREQTARTARNMTAARDCRAMAERMTRRLTRLQDLPPGPVFPFPVCLWRMGDALWLAVEAELYQHFQRELRRRFEGVPIVIMTLANGSRPAYLPTLDSYGKGIYQESIAVLAPGCLEQVLEDVSHHIASLLEN